MKEQEMNEQDKRHKQLHGDGDVRYPFSIEEYQERLTEVRRHMRDVDVDILLVTNSINIYYLSGYYNSGQDVYQCLVVPLNSEPKFVLRQLYFTAVPGLSWIKGGYPVPDTESTLEATVACLKEVGGRSTRVGYDNLTLSLPPSHLDGLRAALSETTFVPAGGLVEKCRLIKSPREIEYIRRACALSVAGMEAGIAEVRPGASENDFAAAFYETVVRGGSGFLSEQPIVVAGPRVPARRTVTEGRPFQTGQSVWFEGAASIHRYNGAIMRTISVGKPSGELIKIHDVMARALDAILAAVKPGVTSGQVDRAGRRIVEESGLGQYWLHRCGYSIGASFPPSWTEGNVMDLKAGDRRQLFPGMTFHTVPWVLHPHLGSVGLSETFLVTADGVDVLTHTPRELRIAS